VRGALAIPVAILAAIAAGCSSGSVPGPPRTEPEPAPAGTGYFVGTGPEGLGASLDLLGDDPVVRVVDAALAARDGRPGEVASVGIVSVVNQGRSPIAMPRFVADLAAGGAVPLRRAADVLRPGEGPAARRALARLRTVPVRVPAGGAATAYVVLGATPPAEVASVRMVVVRGQPVTLTAHRR
jgi:hypothetical protein